jgi:hypothetical protein
MFRKYLAFAAVIAGLGVTGSATAVPISFTFSAINDTLQTFYIFTADGANITVEVDYKLTAISSTEADFAVTVSNTTPTAQPGVNRIVSFGVDVVSPALTGASTSNSLPTAGEWDATITTNFPSFHSVDLCSFAGPNCAGGSSAGVAEQETDTFDLALTGAFGATPSLTFTSPFPGKFQAVGTKGNSFEVDACTSPTNCVGNPQPDPNPTPEPGTLALLGLGLWGVFAMRRRANV